MLRGRCPGLPGTPRRASAHSTGVETEADSFGMELQVALLAAAGSRARREPPCSGALARGSADRGPAVLPKRLGVGGETAAGGTRSPVPGCAFPSPRAHGGHRRGKVRVTAGHGASWGLILRPLCRIQGRSSLLQNSNSPQPYNMQNESKVITHQHLTIHL